ARAAVDTSIALPRVLDAVASGAFSPEEPGRYRGLVEALLRDDRFMVTADFDAYCAAQAEVETLWRDPAAWWRRSVLNTARVGWFSSDRTICDYAAEIWGAPTGIA
ncbi:MAG: glycogen/starch/alpha-glucan phosphorylase, partial [Acetobacteraceae bacterium]|nr:glycogen/starch/alpha-glucan phosphorylase [Acetobacteraceae bacterium]